MSTPTGDEFDDVITPDPEGVLPRDRSEHGKAGRVDDDLMARVTEHERVDAGVDAYDPDRVPPATDAPTDVELTETPEYQAELAEARRVAREGGSAPGA
jgi:hypothetical protein